MLPIHLIVAKWWPATANNTMEEGKKLKRSERESVPTLMTMKAEAELQQQHCLPPIPLIHLLSLRFLEKILEWPAFWGDEQWFARIGIVKSDGSPDIVTWLAAFAKNILQEFVRTTRPISRVLCIMPIKVAYPIRHLTVNVPSQVFLDRDRTGSVRFFRHERFFAHHARRGVGICRKRGTHGNQDKKELMENGRHGKW